MQDTTWTNPHNSHRGHCLWLSFTCAVWENFEKWIHSHERNNLNKSSPLQWFLVTIICHRKYCMEGLHRSYCISIVPSFRFFFHNSACYFILQIAWWYTVQFILSVPLRNGKVKHNRRVVRFVSQRARWGIDVRCVAVTCHTIPWKLRRKKMRKKKKIHLNKCNICIILMQTHVTY